MLHGIYTRIMAPNTGWYLEGHYWSSMLVANKSLLLQRMPIIIAPTFIPGRCLCIPSLPLHKCICFCVVQCLSLSMSVSTKSLTLCIICIGVTRRRDIWPYVGVPPAVKIGYRLPYMHKYTCRRGSAGARYALQI